MRRTGIALMLLLLSASPVQAGSVFRDGSVGVDPAGDIFPDGDTFFIDEVHGEVRNGNLFHSFRDFNLDSTEFAEFSASSSIDNVITRVTGGPSTIAGGIISVIPNADFYFFNPQGIVFTESSTLDIGASIFAPGSFLASTADSVTLTEGFEFPTGSATPLPALNGVSLGGDPLDFGFLSAGPEKQISLEGNALSPAFFSTRTVSLIGGRIEATDRNLTATDILLVSVGTPGTVTGFPDIQSFPGGGQILLDSSDISASFGRISVRTGSLELINASSLQSVAIGGEGGIAGGIDIVANDFVVVQPGSNIQSQFSGLDGAEEIVIRTGRMEVDGGFVGFRGNSSGDPPGDLFVFVDQLQITNGGELSTSGPPGDLFIVANQSVSVSSQGKLSTTGSESNGGNVLVSSPEITLADSSLDTSGGGNGGDITLTSEPPPDLSSTAAVRAFAEALEPGEPVVGDTFRQGLTITNVDDNTAGGDGEDGEFTFQGFLPIPPEEELPLDFPKTGTDPIPPSTDLQVEEDQASVSIVTSRKGLAPAHPRTCDARVAAGGGALFAQRRRGLAVSPEDPLPAFDVLGKGTVAIASEEAELPPVAARPGSIGVVDPGLFEGARAFRSGDFAAAAQRWREASETSQQAGNTLAQSDALRGLGQSQQALGAYWDSLETLERARATAEASGDQARVAAALGALGNTRLALGEPEDAGELLLRAVQLSREAEDSELTAGILNNLGNYRASQGLFDEALVAYEEAATLASDAGHELHQVTALANAARAALNSDQEQRASQLVQRASTATEAWTDSSQKVRLLIHIGKTWAGLARSLGDAAGDALMGAYGAFTAADRIGDERSRSYALGNLGALYLHENRPQEALLLTRLAQRAAEKADASEALYRWHWQEGRLLWREGFAKEAIRSYQRAVDVLEDSRADTRARYGSSDVHFRRAVAPVYLDLASVFLELSGRVDDPKQADRLLREARQTVEQLRAAELRNYFEDECIADIKASERSVEEIAAGAAVVYPIIFPDRMELLVSLPSGLKRYQVPAGSERIAQTANTFRAALETRTTNRYLRPARTLYDWLVRPYAEELENVDTLIFVPDGVLRTIPMAALHDGENFLADLYAIGVAASLNLLGPKPLGEPGGQLLLAGLSKGRQGEGDLSYVPKELQTVKDVYGGKEILLDQKFLIPSVKDKLDVDHPRIVHLATHAVFTGDQDTTYLVTYDGRLKMNDLSDAVGMRRFSEEPIELIVLSACETALGDERAALGLSGVAIRAGARSALGTLWTINDEATSELMGEFYSSLRDPSVNKAVALQRAQAKVRASPAFEHPYYWASFLLLNNWL